jgi:hypothetical protein
MQSPRARALLGVAALAVVVILFIVLSGGGDDESTSPATTSTEAATTTTTTSTDTDKPDKPDKPEEADIPTIVVEDGAPVGGVQELTFTEGDDIRFKVESDVADEVHFHGYDIGEDVEAGGSVTFDVPATLTGKFEVELEESVTQLAEITVNPS